jgi:hypothetical protein
MQTDKAGAQRHPAGLRFTAGNVAGWVRRRRATPVVEGDQARSEQGGMSQEPDQMRHARPYYYVP